MGRGLIRLYLVLWGLWIAFGVATNYREITTYLGYDRWTIQKATERADEFRLANCDGKSTRLECWPGLLDPNEYVTENQVELNVWMFKLAMLKAPFYFFVLLVVLYWLMKWVIAGFKRKKDAKT